MGYQIIEMGHNQHFYNKNMLEWNGVGGDEEDNIEDIRVHLNLIKVF